MATSQLSAFKAGLRASRKKGGGGRSKKIPLAIVAGFMPLAGEVYDGVKAEGIGAVPKRLAKLAGYNAYDKKFELRVAMQVWPGIIAGAVVHKIAGALGINRAIARLPFISI